MILRLNYITSSINCKWTAFTQRFSNQWPLKSSLETRLSDLAESGLDPLANGYFLVSGRFSEV